MEPTQKNARLIVVALAALVAAKSTVAFFSLERNSHKAGNTE